MTFPRRIVGDDEGDRVRACLLGGANGDVCVDGRDETAGFSVDDAIAIARAAHQGQVDKGGEPYIGHPLRVMGRVEGEY